MTASSHSSSSPEPGDELEALEAELARELLAEQGASGSSGPGGGMEAELAQEVPSGAGAEADAADDLDELEAEFAELTSPRAEEVDVEAAFEAMMAGSAAGQTDGGLVFVRDLASADDLEPLRMMEASDTDEMAESTDSARSRSSPGQREPRAWTQGMIVDIETGDGWERGVVVLGPAESGESYKMSVKFTDGSVEDWETAEFVKPGINTPGSEPATAAVSTERRATETVTATRPTDQTVGLGAPGPLDGLAEHTVETADPGGRMWSHLYKASKHGTQYQVQEDGLPAVFTLHQDHVSVEYSDDQTGASRGANRQILFADIRSWRSNGSNVEIELEGADVLRLTCEEHDSAEFIAHELAHFSTTAHAITTATAAKIDLERSASEKALLQAQVSELKAALQYAQEVQRLPTSTALDPRENGDSNLVAALAEAEAKVQEERLSSSQIAQELKTVRAAYADTLAELHQVTEQYARELAKRTGTICEREATIRLLQEHDDKPGSIVQETTRETDSAQEVEQLRAQLAEAELKVQEMVAAEAAEKQQVAEELVRAKEQWTEMQQAVATAKAEHGSITQALKAQLITTEAEAVNNAARASEAEAKCISLTANLAAAEQKLRSFQAQPSPAALGVSAELVDVKDALAAETKARKAERDAHSSIIETHQVEIAALIAEHQVEMQRERHTVQERMHTALQSAMPTTPIFTGIDLEAKMEISKNEQLRLEAAVQAVSTDAETHQRAFIELQHTHMKLAREHSDTLESCDAELSQWLALSAQTQQQHRNEADCSTALMVEVNQWLSLSERVRPQYPKSQQQAIISKLRTDFADLQVDHEMEIAKLERQVGAQARELSSAAEKILRAEAAREEAEKVAMGLAEGLDDKSILSASQSSSQLEEEKTVEVQKLQHELNAAKDEKAGLLEQIDDLSSKLHAEDKSPRQNALAIVEITDLKSRLLDTTSQLERVTIQHAVAQEELRHIKAVPSTNTNFRDESLNDASSAEIKLSDATAEMKKLEQDLHTTSKELEVFRGKHADAERQRQEETRQAYTRAENKAMIADIFGFCDATGSGVLQQAEYKLYLEGIGAWGTPPRVDDKFDAQWIVECTQMGCDHEVGITWEAFEGHIYAQCCEDVSKEGTQQLEEHLAGVKRVFRAKIAEIQQDNVEMRDSIKMMLAQHRSQSQADKEEADVERSRRHAAEAEAERLGQHWMDAELARVIELGIVEAVCEAEAHENTKQATHTATRHHSEQLTLQETLVATRQELSAMVQLRSEAEASAKDLQKRLQEYESGMSVESKTRQTAEATVDAHATTIVELRQELDAAQQELTATVAAAKAEQATAAAKFASKEAELAVSMAKAEGKLGVVATERNAALQTVSLHEQRLAEKEADFAKAAQEEVAVLHTKLQLADQRLDRVSRHTATLIGKARAEEQATWTEEKRTLTARLKAQEMEMDRVLTVRISALQEQVTSTIVAVETKAAGVELALRERLEQEESSAKAAQAAAAAEISRLAGLLDTAERTLLDRVPTLEGALSKAERETHAARAAHATDRAEVLDQHAVAIAAAEQAKATLLQESSERISAVMAQASESTASLSSEIAVKASQWDEDRKRMTTQLDTISSQLDALQIEYDKETAAHKKCQILLADKERTIANQEEAAKHMGGLLRKAIDEKTTSSSALAERTAAWNAVKSSLIRDRDVALKECDGLIKRLKLRHAEELGDVTARSKEELAFAKIEQDGLRARLGQKDLAHSKTVTALEATMRTLTHERDMACAELQRRNASFGQERQQLIAERDASHTQADEAEASSALAAQQLYDIGTELSTVRSLPIHCL
eukprot:COSAG02_NODE_859_length_16438_cov_11.496236_6_plen_1824_part_00